MTTREAAEGSLGVVLHAMVGSVGMWWGQLGCGGVGWVVMEVAGMWWGWLGCLLEVLVLLLPPGFHREVSASLQREN